MNIRLIYDSDSGYKIILAAETKEEQAIVHLFSGLKDITTERDSSFHESYNLAKSITIRGRNK